MRVVTPRVREAPVLAVDFDGVVHRYSQGWHGGAVYDDPVDGCKDALHGLSKRYSLVLFTARHDLAAVHLWLVTHGLRQYFSEITNRKPAAVAYLDDRAVRFHDWPTALTDLEAL